MNHCCHKCSICMITDLTETSILYLLWIHYGRNLKKHCQWYMRWVLEQVYFSAAVESIFKHNKEWREFFIESSVWTTLQRPALVVCLQAQSFSLLGFLHTSVSHRFPPLSPSRSISQLVKHIHNSHTHPRSIYAVSIIRSRVTQCLLLI